jgi:hypothetical protein
LDPESSISVHLSIFLLADETSLHTWKPRRLVTVLFDHLNPRLVIGLFDHLNPRRLVIGLFDHTSGDGLRIFVETWFSLTVCAILFSMLTTEWGWPTDYTIFVATCGMTVYTIFLILLDNVVIIVDTLQNPPAPIPETRSVKGPFDPLNFRLVTGLFDHLNHLNANVAPSHLTDLTPAAVESLVSLKN